MSDETRRVTREEVRKAVMVNLVGASDPRVFADAIFDALPADPPASADVEAACSVCGVPIAEHPDTDACALRAEAGTGWSDQSYDLGVADGRARERAEAGGLERAAWLAGWIACGSQMTTWTEEALMLEAERQYARLAGAER